MDLVGYWIVFFPFFSLTQFPMDMVDLRQIYCRGILLKINYEREFVFKLFTRGVCSSMDAARRTGDKGVPSLQMARSMMSWRVPPVTQARHADVKHATNKNNGTPL